VEGVNRDLAVAPNVDRLDLSRVEECVELGAAGPQQHGSLGDRVEQPRGGGLWRSFRARGDGTRPRGRPMCLRLPV
jgi:hypothetical protein